MVSESFSVHLLAYLPYSNLFLKYSITGQGWYVQKAIPNQQDIGPLCPQARLTDPTMQDRWCEERKHSSVFFLSHKY
jgi:hypothetical protein